ncbi:hypothetical protein RSJ42_04165 [Methanosarcina hadiensis]
MIAAGGLEFIFIKENLTKIYKKYKLKGKSAAIEFIVKKYEKKLL